MKKYTIYFKVNVDLTDTETIIIYVDQGWDYGDSNPYQTLVVTLSKAVEIEAENDAHIKMYANSINKICGIDQYIDYIIDNEGQNEVPFELQHDHDNLPVV